MPTPRPESSRAALAALDDLAELPLDEPADADEPPPLHALPDPTDARVEALRLHDQARRMRRAMLEEIVRDRGLDPAILDELDEPPYHRTAREPLLSWDQLPERVGLGLPEFLAAGTGPVSWFGPVVEGGVAAFIGRPESFKSFAAMQLGLAGACGGSWLGLELGEPRPFVYLSAEKSGATVRDRLARMSATLQPAAPVWVVHRSGVTFGDRSSWRRVVALVRELGPRTFVVADTVASLAGPGFDENSGRDMAVVLGALRELVDAGATVAALHHPAKHGEGNGGIRMRGHTSLWGEVDGTIEFSRPDRSVEAGLARVEPKDGDLHLIPFRWDRSTFLLEQDAGVLPLTAASVASIVEALYVGSPLSAGRIAAEFTGHGRTIILERIREAVDAGLLARLGRGKATGYVPVPRLMRARQFGILGAPAADDSDEALADDSPVTQPPIVRTAHAPEQAIVRRDDQSSAIRPDDRQSVKSSVRPGGSIEGPRADNSQPDANPTDERAASAGAVIDCRDYRAHQSQHRQVDGRWTCDACTPEWLLP